MISHQHNGSGIGWVSIGKRLGLFVFWCFMLFGCHTVIVGQPLTETEAVKLALAHFPSIQIANLEIKRNQALERTAFNLPQPEIAIETPADNGPGVEVEQNFDFPLVYTRRHKWLKQKTALAEKEAEVTLREVKRDVRLAYLDAQIASSLEAFHSGQEITWKYILDNSRLLFDAGQINRADLLASERYAYMAILRAEEAQLTLSNALKILGYYTDTTPDTLSPPEMLEWNGSMQSDAYYFEKSAAQAQYVSKAEIKWHRARRWPGFLLGYTRASEPDTEYSNRLKAGITIPLWQGQYTGEIKAAGIEYDQKAYRLDWMRSQAITKKLQLEETIATTKELLDWFYEQGLANVETEADVAGRLFEGGEMDLNWVLRTRAEAADFYTQFLGTLKKHNTAVIELDFLLEN